MDYKKVPKLTVYRARGNRGIIMPCGFANAASDGVSPETQTTVAEHAQKEEVRLRESKVVTPSWSNSLAFSAS